MAISLTYNNPSVQESLLDTITNLSPKENQLFTGLQKSSTTSTRHEWLTDSFDSVTNTSTDKKAVEGAEFGVGDVTNPVRKTNYTQIIVQDWKVSGTEMAVKHAGMVTPKAYHMTKGMDNWKNKAEWALLHGVANAGNASTAREMGGVFDQVTTGKVANLAAPLTETLFNDYMGFAWARGGSPDTIYVGATLKRKISSFTAGSQRQIEAADKRLVSAVDIYEGDFGIVKIFKHRYIDSVVPVVSTYNMAILQESTWAIASLREPQNVEVAKTGDFEKGAIVGELTLECRYEQANQVVKGITG